CSTNVMRYRNIFAMGVMSVVAGLPGCDNSPSGSCVAMPNPGIAIEIRDAVTRAPAAQGATGYITSGAFTGQLHGGLELEMFGADDRPGSYSVVIEKPGYQRWDTSGVVVKALRCGVDTARFVALLQPA
ncbi:MAG: hypothetical protein ACRENP_30295, partial [Longimicrobiales bacterium]